MSRDVQVDTYERKVTGAEGFYAHSPFSVVTMVARIRGTVTEEMLKHAVAKAQERHALLRVRIREDAGGAQWFTSAGVQQIPIEIVPRQTETDWIRIYAEASSIPYEFETHPAIRFILVQSPEVSELIILCHHMICDGLSLAYLARDLMVHLGDPSAEADILPAPAPVTLDGLPDDVPVSGIVKFFINRIGQKWAEEAVVFDQEDYRALTDAYWHHSRPEIFCIELSEEETSALVGRCKRERVSVNSALAAAFAGAQSFIEGAQPYHAKVAIGASLRDRLPNPPGEAMGYYAGGVELKWTYNQGKGFWENARGFHKKIKPNLTNKKVFGEVVKWLQMDSNIYEALNFKQLGALVAPESPRYEKLSAFGRREDVVSGLLRRVKMDTLETKILGAAVTNLGRLDFPRTYGALELDRLIMQPGGAFPLSHVNLVLGAVTCSGKLSLVVEYAEETVDAATMAEIKDKAMALLGAG